MQTKLKHISTNLWKNGGYVIAFENEMGDRYILQMLEQIFKCPGFGCSMHDDWVTVNLKEPQDSPTNRYKETMYLVRKDVFFHNPELAIEIGFDHDEWQRQYAFEGAVGIKAFKHLECRQRYLKEVAFDPNDKTIWHDDYIDSYTGTAYF